MAKKPPILCAFCEKPQSGEMIKGVKNVFICEDCVELCSSMLENKSKEKGNEKNDITVVPSPKELVAYLDRFVVGQNETKKILSVAVSSHYKRLKDNHERENGRSLVSDPILSNVIMEKSNILLLGPTGCGKTLLAKCLADRLSVPLAIGDATALTEAGYVGEDVENLLVKLLMKADYDLDLAQRGIIFIDEIDKIGKTHGNVSITRDVSGEGVQQGLLKIIEGTIANVPPAGGRKHPDQQYIQFDTSNVLFIAGGAFSGLGDIIRKRTGGGSIGFGADPKKDQDYHKLLPQVEPEDLEQFGLIPEFIGRLPVLAPMEELTEGDMVRILTEPENAILKQYQKQFAMEGAKLTFTTDAVREIAKIAKEKKTGARALRSVVEKFMLDIMYEAAEHIVPDAKFEIGIDVVRGGKFFPQKDAA